MNDSIVSVAHNIKLEGTRLPVTTLPLQHAVLLWLLFFVICCGLGYPTLSRYDPAHTEGLTDSIVYQQMVVGSPAPRSRVEVFGGRVLVPYTARLVYSVVGSHLNTWNPVALSILLSAALFCATTALLLVILGRCVVGNLNISLLAATLYLLSFAIPNLQLAGLIDSGESLFMLALAWSLISRKWWLLPVWGAGGVLAKETFLPFAAVFAIVWWLDSERKYSQSPAAPVWISGMILLSVITLVLIRLALFGHAVWPWQIAASMNSRTNFLISLWNCISDRSFWYVFVWLLPLGVWRLGKLPRSWVMASIITALVALLLGAYNDMAGTVARPIFNILGPMLSLSVAMLIARTPAQGFGSQYQTS